MSRAGSFPTPRVFLVLVLLAACGNDPQPVSTGEITAEVVPQIAWSDPTPSEVVAHTWPWQTDTVTVECWSSDFPHLYTVVAGGSRYAAPSALPQGEFRVPGQGAFGNAAELPGVVQFQPPAGVHQAAQAICRGVGGLTMAKVSKLLAEVYGGIDPKQVQADYAHVLASGERVEYACKTVRDLFIVTDRRILNVDKKGVAGQKKNYITVPFSKVASFAVEFGGKLAGLVTVRLWTSGAEPIEVIFHKSADGEGIQKVLATQICGTKPA